MALQECEKMFADMMRYIERMQQEMSKLISANKRAALSNAEGHMERLTHEIADLKRRDNEITQLSRTEDHIHFIQVTDNMTWAPSILSHHALVEKVVSYRRQVLERSPVNHKANRLVLQNITSNTPYNMQSHSIQYHNCVAVFLPY